MTIGLFAAAGPASAAAPVSVSMSAAVVCNTFDGTSSTSLAVFESGQGFTPGASYDVFVQPNGPGSDTALDSDPVTADDRGVLTTTQVEYADSFYADAASWFIQNVSNGVLAASGTLVPTAGCAGSPHVSVSVAAAIVCSTYDGTQATAATVTAAGSGFRAGASVGVTVVPNGTGYDTALNNDPMTVGKTGQLTSTQTEYADTWFPRTATWLITDAGSGVTIAAGSISVAGCPAPTAAAPTVPGMFAPLPPTPVLDTGIGLGAPMNPVPAHGALSVHIAGSAGVPATGAASVLLSMTAFLAGQDGFISADRVKTVPSLNFSRGRTSTALVLAPLAADGTIRLGNNSAGSVQLTANVTGYYRAGTATAPGSFTAITPRTVLTTVAQAMPSHGTSSIRVTDNGTPAAGISTGLFRVTVSGASQSGTLTAYNGVAPRPRALSMSFPAGRTTTDLVLAPVNPNTGYTWLYNGSAADIRLSVSLVGYYRSGTPTATGAFGAVKPTPSYTATRVSGTFTFGFTGVNGVPATGVSALLFRVTITHPAAAGTLSVFAGNTDFPVTPNLSFAADTTASQLVVVPVGPDGTVSFSWTADADLSADLAGFVYS